MHLLDSSAYSITISLPQLSLLHCFPAYAFVCPPQLLFLYSRVSSTIASIVTPPQQMPLLHNCFCITFAFHLQLCFFRNFVSSITVFFPNCVFSVIYETHTRIGLWIFFFWPSKIYPWRQIGATNLENQILFLLCWRKQKQNEYRKIIWSTYVRIAALRVALDAVAFDAFCTNFGQKQLWVSSV